MTGKEAREDDGRDPERASDQKERVRDDACAFILPNAGITLQILPDGILDVALEARRKSLGGGGIRSRLAGSPSIIDWSREK